MIYCEIAWVCLLLVYPIFRFYVTEMLGVSKDKVELIFINKLLFITIVFNTFVVGELLLVFLIDLC